VGKVSVIATLRAKEGKADGFTSAFEDLFPHVENEDGTEQYMLHRSTTDPNLFFVTEVYKDQAAFDAHAGSDAFAKLGAALGDSIETFDLQFAEPVKAVGFDL
jgi:quinol monooxygenase YgiN